MNEQNVKKYFLKEIFQQIRSFEKEIVFSILKILQFRDDSLSF